MTTARSCTYRGTRRILNRTVHVRASAPSWRAMTQPVLTCQDFDMAGSAGPWPWRPDAAGLHDDVLAVDGVDVLGWLPGTPGIPVPGMFGQVMEYRHPVFSSWAVRFPIWRRGRLYPADDPAQPAEPFPGTAHQLRDLHDVLALLDGAVLADGFHASWGTCVIAASSVPVIIHSQVNSTLRRGRTSTAGA